MRINKRIFTKKVQKRGYVDVQIGIKKETGEGIAVLLGTAFVIWLIVLAISAFVTSDKEREYYQQACTTINKGASSYVRNGSANASEGKWMCRNNDTGTEIKL